MIARTTRLAAALLASASWGLLTAHVAIASTFAENDGVLHTHYDGVTNELLTAGLGKTRLGSAVALGFADPLHPTAEELRRLAIYNNYRALIDPTPGGGYAGVGSLPRRPWKFAHRVRPNARLARHDSAVRSAPDRRHLQPAARR
jgi:hypothetical protein